MIERVAISTVLFMFYTAVATSALIGLDVGYKAPTADAASVEFNGTHMDAGDAEIAGTILSDTSAKASEQGIIEQTTVSLLKAMFSAVAYIADGFATIGFTIKPWMPAPILDGLLTVLNFGIFGGYVYVNIQRVRKWGGR